MPDANRENPEHSRRSERVDLEGRVTIRVPAGTIEGTGRNVSVQGVFFTTDQPIRVEVEIEGHAAPIRGQLVRLENLGPGQRGVAVMFDEVAPGLVDPAGSGGG